MAWYRRHSHPPIENLERLRDDVDFSLPAQPHLAVVMDTLDPFIANEDTNNVALAARRYREMCWIVRQYRQIHI